VRIKARFDSICAKCGRPIKAGDSIDWVKGTSTSHAECPAKAAASFGDEVPIILHRTERGRPAANAFVGQVMKNRRTDGYVTVVSHTARYIKEDGLSLGLDDDSGWLVTLTCRLANDEELAGVRAEHAKREARLAAHHRLTEIKNALVGYGEFPEKVEPFAGEQLVRDQHGREDDLILDNGTLWLLRYNGRDGDCWANNNLGGHTLAWRCPAWPELVDEIRTIASAMKAR
jgi:hypothetical protein